MERNRTRWWDGLLCGCLVVLAILGTRNVGETGFFDEFSYLKTVDVLAHTGHFVYNGWATAMLGWQAYWGVLFVRIFGTSYASIRLSMLPIAFFTIWIFFLVLVRFGRTRREAYFGALLLGFSPIFIPSAASYMTDVPGELVIVLCIYLCQRAVMCASPQASIAWLTAAACSNVVGGTARQIAWLGALVMLPSTAWLLRKRRGVLPAGILLWLLSAACIFACMRWLAHQHYALVEPIFVKVGVRSAITKTVENAVRVFFCAALLLFPLLVVWLKRLRRLRPVVWIGIPVIILGFDLVNSRIGNPFHTIPWLNDFIRDFGMGGEYGWSLGFAPVMIHRHAGYVISFFIIGSALVFAIDMFLDRASIRRTFAGVLKADIAIPWNFELWILLPFSVCYLFLLIPRGITLEIADRYLLGLLPLGMVCLFKLAQHRFKNPLPAISYALLLLMCLWSVAGTHDLFAMNRARLRAFNILRSSNIPESQIQVGLDHDGWYQLQHSPSVNDYRIRVPAGTYHKLPKPDLDPNCILWSYDWTPAIDPQYFVVLSRVDCLASSSFQPVTFRAWLPPFHRTILIQQRP